MYFKKELLKSINEMYYRNFQGTELFPLSIDSSKTKIYHFYEEFKKTAIFKTINKESDAEITEYHDQILDFYFEDEHPFSILGKKLKKTVDEMSNTINYRMTGKNLQLIEEVLLTSEKSVLVGGAVRDSILGLKPKDWDFATDIPYNELKEKFREKGFKVQEEGKQFLVMIISKDGEQYEIANFRTDGTYTDGRRPDSVSIGTPKEDAFRRDFSVNALFFNLTTMKVQDFTGCGIKDILNKELKFVGKPEDRLKEDKLRVFRFYRFIDKLGFKPGTKDLKAVRTYFDEACKEVASERIKNEIEKIVGLK